MKCKFNSKYEDSCQETEIKNEGSFIVERIDLVDGKCDKNDKGNVEIHEFKFVVNHKKDELSRLCASKGECNDLATRRRSQKCGFGGALMHVCFNDEKITSNHGLDLNNPEWKDGNLRETAAENCLTIIHVDCYPGQFTPDIVCLKYLQNGRNNDFEIIFTEEHNILDDDNDDDASDDDKDDDGDSDDKNDLDAKGGGDSKEKDVEYHVLEIGTAIDDFAANNDEFMKKYGRKWFFCKCNPSKKQACLDMA